MPVPEWFEEISLDDVESLVSEHVPDGYETNRDFFEGDHWQEGDGWIGPYPDEGTVDDETLSTVRQEIKRSFTSKNVISEVVDRHAAGVAGRRPLWRLIPTDEDQLDEDGDPNERMEERIEEAESLVADWWDERDVDATLEEAVETLLLGSRASLRLFVPRGLLETTERDDGGTTTQIPDGGVEDQLDRIYVDDLDPNVAIVWEDSDTRKELSIVVYEIDTGDPTKSGTGETVDRAELSWVDENGETTIRILQENVDDRTISVDIGGRLTLRELERPTLVSEQVRQQQKALNLANSMIPRNVITGGFLERTLLNAQVPGKMVQDEDTGEKRYQPDPLEFGPGTVNVLRGIEVSDAEGNEKLTTPKIEYRDPIPIDSSEDAKRSHYRDILEEVDQAHVEITGDATASGRSREQARAEYERSLERTRTPVEDAVRWLVSTALAMAESFANGSESPISGDGDELFAEQVRVDVTVPLDTGPISSEEIKATAELVSQGLLSRETGLRRVGVDDVDAEIDRIDAQEDRELEIAKQRAATILRYTRAGADIMTAAIAAGMDDDEAEELFSEIAQREARREEQESGFRDRVRAALRGEEGEGEEEGEPEGENE